MIFAMAPCLLNTFIVRESILLTSDVLSVTVNIKRTVPK